MKVSAKAFTQGIVIGSVLLTGILSSQNTSVNAGSENKGEDTCPQTSPWVKVEGLDETSYTYTAPAGMVIVEVCYKASNDVIYLAGNYQNSITITSTVTNDKGKVQDLSHASFMLQASASPSTSATASPSPSDCPSDSPKASPSVSAEPTPSASVKASPSASPDETVSPKPSPDQSASPSPEASASVSPSPSASAQSSATPAPSSTGGTNTSSNNSSSDSSSSSDNSAQGQVLGATLADAGVVEDVMMNALGSLGGLMTLAGSVLYGKKKRS